MLILSCSTTSIALLIVVARRILHLIQIIVPILLIVMVIYNLFQLMNNPELKNGQKMIINKVIAAVVVFMIPILLEAFLNLLPGRINFIECWNEIRVSNNLKPEVEYIPVDDTRERLPIIHNASDYEYGKSDTSNSTSSNTSKTKKTNVTGKDIVAYAEQFYGKPYKAGGYWNGEYPYTSTDCVGFVRGVYKHFGIKIPTNASKFFTTPDKFTVVTGQPLKAGDIVVYNHHRALATGQGNRLIHAMGVKYGIGHSKDYRSCGAGPVRGVVRVNSLSD